MAPELADVARSVIDANRYMALGTADEKGHPWVTPVWFASEDDRNFHWVSSPDAKHSRNLAAEPRVEIFDRVSRLDHGRAYALDDVRGSALIRLYRATVSEHWVLIPGRDPDRGSGIDRSERVSLD